MVTLHDPAARWSCIAMTLVGLACVFCGCAEDELVDEVAYRQFPDVPAVDHLLVPQDASVMVLVPGGEFLMGTSDADVEAYADVFPFQKAARYDNELPQRSIHVDAFWIDQLEVTNAQYRSFLDNTGYEPERYLSARLWTEPDMPALVLAWIDAERYASWAGKRLPTEAEWEKAARGTDGRFWPWGNVWDPTILSGNDGTGLDDGYIEFAPVGQFLQSASVYGALDMAGNAWEWVADRYDREYYTYGPLSNPQGPATGDGWVLKGGGWAENKAFTRPASRVGGNAGSLLIGFRCAMDAE